MPKSLTPLTGGTIPGDITLVTFTAATAPAPASSAAGVEIQSATKATRVKLDLQNVTETRLTGMVIATGSTAGSSIKLSYMTTEAATWAGTDAGPVLVVGSNGGAAGVTHDSGWVALPAAAKVANCTLACLVGTAFGLTAPTMGSLRLYLR